MTVRPLSARNPRVQRLARLARRREDRAGERAFLVEGPVLLGTALDAGAEVREVFVAAGAPPRPATAEVLGRLGPATDVWEVPAGVLTRVGDTATSQGLIAVVGRPDHPWPEPARAPFVLVLADVADPGNAGTLIRSAAAAGAGAVVVAGGVDPSSPKVVRASAGAVFSVPVVEVGAPGRDGELARQAVARLADDGYRTIATVVDPAAPSLFDADLDGPVAVVLGNEAHGLDAATVAACAAALHVPMAGPTESLNVAMAGTVVCFEVLRRRSTR